MKAMSLRIRMQTLSPCLTPSLCKPPAMRAARFGDFGVAAPPLAADDAEEKGLRWHHFLSDLSTGLSLSRHAGSDATRDLEP